MKGILIGLTIASVLASAILFAPLSEAQDADNAATLFISMTSEDLWDCQMALGYAERVHGMGYNVVLFLNVRGVLMANKSLPQPAMAATGKSPAETIAALAGHGVAVYVCPMCMEHAGMTKDDLLAGTREANEEMVRIQMDVNTKVMSY